MCSFLNLVTPSENLNIFKSGWRLKLGFQYFCQCHCLELNIHLNSPLVSLVLSTHLPFTCILFIFNWLWFSPEDTSPSPDSRGGRYIHILALMLVLVSDQYQNTYFSLFLFCKFDTLLMFIRQVTCLCKLSSWRYLYQIPLRYLIYEHYSFNTVYLNFKGFVTVSCVAVKAEPRDKGWTKEDCFIFGLKNAKTPAKTRKLPDHKGNTELTWTTQHRYTLEGIKAEWTQLGTLLNRIRLTREGKQNWT